MQPAPLFVILILLILVILRILRAFILVVIFPLVRIVAFFLGLAFVWIKRVGVSCMRKLVRIARLL